MNLINKKTIISFMLFCFIALVAFGQESMVEGTVVSGSGDPLINAKITVKENPDVTVYTDDGGNFSVFALGDQHLIVEYRNEARKTVKASELAQDNQIVLDETSELVNVGFNTKLRRGEIASSVGSVRGEQLNSTVQMPGNALFGQISGLRVFQNTGYSPDDRQPYMDIRGVATTQDNSILVLVDGVQRPLNSLVLENIESVTVLRDAAAKARYGLLGGNGVLLVTTKRGHVGKTQFNISFDQGISQPNHSPKFLNAPDYARAVNEALTNDGQSPRYASWDISRFESGAYPTLWPDVDWMDQTLGDMGKFSRFNFDVTGGDKTITYYLGLNYQNEYGLYNHTDAYKDFTTQLFYDNFSFRTNLDILLTPSTKAIINLGGHIQSDQGPGVSGIVEDAFEIPSALFPVKNYDGSWGGTNLYGNNPVAELSATGMISTQVRNTFIDIRLEQDLKNIVEGLSAEVSASYDSWANFLEGKTSTYGYKEIKPVVDSVGTITDTIINNLGKESDLNPSRSPGNIQTNHSDIRGKLKYSKSFGEHNIDGWILFQQEALEQRGNNSIYRWRNFVGNIFYGLSDKYFLDATITYSGSNAITEKKNRYELYPAIAGNWMISKEPFMKDIAFINFLKLRASYGRVGNGRINMNDLTHTHYGGYGSYFLGNRYTAHGTLAETNIPIEMKKYESSLESNFGIDAQLLDKLYLNGELFYVKRNNIFVPSTGLYSEVLGILPENAPNGEVENKGYELEMSWRDQSGDFTYFITGRFSRYQNKIININEEFRPYDYMKREGKPVGQYFGWESEGFYASESDIQNSPSSQLGSVRPGDIKYIDQNDDGYINEFDQVAIGNPSVPQIYYSADLGIGYKGFHVSVLFQGTKKSSAYLHQGHIFWPLQGNSNISSWYVNYWSESNHSDAKLPRLTTKSNTNNFRVNDIWMRDNSFLKLRYAEISYSLPKDFIAKLGMQQLNIYIRGRNLFCLDEIDYVDPENPYVTYPDLRKFNVGIKATF